jgi:hypothetical protein
MSTDGDGVGVRAPTWLNGFVAAGMVNASVAVTSWLTGTHRFAGSGGLSYNYDAWLWPVTSFLTVSAVAGLVFATVRGWRRFGAGLMSGAVTCAVLDLAWTFGYFVALGS